MWWSDWRPVPEARSLVQFQYCALNGYNGWNGNHPGPKPSHRRLLHVGVRVLLVRGGNKRMAHVFAIRAISFIIQDDGPCPMPCDLKLDGWPFFLQPLTHWIFWLLWFSSFLKQGGNIFFCPSKWTGMKQVLWPGCKASVAVKSWMSGFGVSISGLASGSYTIR